MAEHFAESIMCQIYEVGMTPHYRIKLEEMILRLLDVMSKWSISFIGVHAVIKVSP